MDNSEFSRNGDYSQSRLHSQQATANIISNGKSQAHPENSLGIVAMAGEYVRVLVTPTGNMGKVLTAISDIAADGETDLVRGLQMAQMALKNRQNKLERQRIVVFVGSPISSTEKELEKIGKFMKKNNVSVDIISFGETEANSAKLQKLHTAVNASDTSNLVIVEPGPVLMSDTVRNSKICGGGDGGGGGGDGGDFDLAEQDPELAMAIRISMEEERARQNTMQGGDAPAATETSAADATAATPAAATPAPAAAPVPAGMEGMNPAFLASLDPEVRASLADDPELLEALMMSFDDANPPAAETPAPAAAAETPEPPAKKAKQEEDAPAAPTPAEAPAPPVPVDMNAMFQDVDFVQDLLGGLPGVDVTDTRIQDALREVGVTSPKDDKDKKPDDKPDEAK